MRKVGSFLSCIRRATSALILGFAAIALRGQGADLTGFPLAGKASPLPVPPGSTQVCSPLTGRVLEPFPVTANQPASTRRMIERIHQVMLSTDTRSHFYMSGESALELKAMLQSSSRLQALDIKPLYAEFLLRAGDSEGALKEFNDWEDMMHESRISLRESDVHHLMISKAICSLRIGEQENCLLNHTTDSCIFPISGGGVHKLPRGSQGAVDQLLEILYRAPNNLAARWLLNIAYMTLGKYPDQVPSRWLIPPSAFASEYDLPHFPDVAGKLGLDVDDLAGGVVMEDFDGDGFLDLMVSSCSLHGQLRIFRNNGDGTFTERTVEAGLAGVVGGLNMIHADYNNDGRPDVFVLRGGWEKAGGKIPNSLLRNNGNFTFTDVTEEAGVLSFHPTQTAVWFDFNGDGWLDLFIGNENTDQGFDPCELYRNNRDGTFTECAAECGVQVIGFVKGVASGDYDNDGRPDLYISRRDGPNLLFHNDGPVPASGTTPGVGGWKFTEVSTAAKVADAVYGFPCWFFDYDNDGWLDLMVTGYRIHDVGDVAADYLGKPTDGAKAHLYHNNHDGTFTDVSRTMGVSKVLHAMGVNFGDLDNDGWLDFYVGTGDPQFDTLIPNRMFRNDGGQRFQDVTTAGGFGVLQKGHGVAFGDINNDGSQDIYEVVGGAYSGDNYRNMLFANPGNANAWIKLSLEGVQSNRSAIGARITVVVPGETGERKITSTVGSGASFGSSSFRREIGLGKVDRVLRVEVFWPVTGKSQTFTDLKINHFYRLREGDAAAVNLPLKSFPLPTATSPDRHYGW